MTSERVPCPRCGIGVYPAYQQRHQGSKACARLRLRMEFTKQMFSTANELLVVAARLRELAEGLKA